MVHGSYFKIQAVPPLYKPRISDWSDLSYLWLRAVLITVVIGNLLLFGIAGVAIIHILNPAIYKVLGLVSLSTRNIIMTVLLVVIAVDFVVSYFVPKLVKVGVDSSEADNTEEISKEVRALLTNRSYFYSRFADAYPEVVYKTERVQARLLRRILSLTGSLRQRSSTPRSAGST